MVKVLIDSGRITATYPLRDVPREKWRELMLARRTFLEITLSHDCRCLVEFCNDAKEMHLECGFASAEQMIRDGYGLEPEEISVAVEWLKLNPPAEPITLDQAVKLGKHGVNQHTGGSPTTSTIRKPMGRGAAYILARLDRDGYDELAAKVRTGEISAKAAAHLLGWRKKLTPFERIEKLLPKLTLAQLENLLALLDEIRRRAA